MGGSLKVLVVALSARVGGGLSYVTRQIRALALVRPGWSIEVLASPWNAPTLRRLEGVRVATVRVHGTVDRIAFEQVVLPITGRRADVIYCPGNFVPFAATRPIVVAQQNPHYFGRGRVFARTLGPRVRLERALAVLSMRRADRVIVISESLADEIAADGLTAANQRLIQSGAPIVADSASRPAGIGEGPFFLSLANDSPHKRLDDVVRAWGALDGANAAGLVLAGRIVAGSVDRHRASVPAARADRLTHLGPVGDPREVRWLLEHATALVVPSELEAFPLTPAEAGAVGCPLILSDIPPHREVTGGRGAYFAVGDVGALTRAMASIGDDPDRDPWRWPISWEDHAERLARVLDEARAGRA